jgi:hypothetical protein
MVAPYYPPGTPLPGGGVAGLLYTWTEPPLVAWQGWVPTGTTWTPTAPWSGLQLQAFFPAEPPSDAGPPPAGGGIYTVIRVMTPGGWWHG